MNKLILTLITTNITSIVLALILYLNQSSITYISGTGYNVRLSLREVGIINSNLRKPDKNGMAFLVPYSENHYQVLVISPIYNHEKFFSISEKSLLESIRELTGYDYANDVPTQTRGARIDGDDKTRP